MSKKYEIVVLGSGPGGYVAAIRSAQLGYKTAIVEKDELGGICLNWGCIPTKSLLRNAELIDINTNHSEEFGLSFSNFKFDFEKIIKRSRGVSEKIVKGVTFLMRKNKIDHIKGFGKFKDKTKLAILDNDGNETDEIEFEKIIIATGSRPRQFDNIPVDRKSIITSKEAMSLDKQPKELIVIGAGAIGIEFAYFYNVLGTKVTVIEMKDSILPVEDKEISAALEKSLKKRGIEIYTGTTVEKAEVKGKKVTVTIEKDGAKQELKAEKVLSAVGVTGNIENFGLEDIGVEIEKNHIKVNKETFQTNVDGVYAIGDVIGPPWLAHVASHEGIHCIEKIHGMDKPALDYNSIPGCTYCQPQVASIGLTEEKAREKGYEIKIGKFPFSASGKASAVGDKEGFVKMIFDAKYGELLGAHIIGTEATEMIAEVGIAKSLEATYETILDTVHAHPTLSEAIMEAAGDAYGEAIHI